MPTVYDALPDAAPASPYDALPDASPAPNPYDALPAAPTRPAPDLSAIKVSPYEKVGKDPEEIGNADFLTAVGRDPIGFVKSLPASAGEALVAPGKLAYYQAADAVSKLFNEPEYGGNIAAMEQGEDVLPVHTFVNHAAQTNPKLAVTAKLGQAAAEMAPTLGLAAAPAAVNRLLAAGFSAQMIASAPQLFNAYADETSKPVAEQDPGKLADLKSQLIQTFIFAPLAGAGATHGLDTAAIDRFVPRGAGIEGGPGNPAGQPPITGEQLAETGGQPAPTGTIVPKTGPGGADTADVSPNALKDLQDTLTRNQVPVQMPGQKMLDALRQAPQTPLRSEAVTAQTGAIAPEAEARQATEAAKTADEPTGQPTAVNEADGLIDASLKRGDISQGEALVMKAQVRVNAAKLPAAEAPAETSAIAPEQPGEPRRPTILRKALQETPADYKKRVEHFQATGEVLAPIAPEPDSTALTEQAPDETSNSGAAAETITGQNERTGSEATAATTPAAAPMPAEDLNNPQKPLPPPTFKVGDKLEHDGTVKTVTRVSFNPKYVVLDGKMVSVSETRPVPAKAALPETVAESPDFETVEVARVKTDTEADRLVDENVNQRSFRRQGDKYVVYEEREKPVTASRSAAVLPGKAPVDFSEKILQRDLRAEADPTLDYLRSLKVDTKGQVHAFGLAPSVWNTLVDSVILGVRGGRKIADAVTWAIDRLKEKFPDAQFDEAGAREHFEKTAVGNLRYESPDGKAVTPAEQMKARRAEIDQRLAEISPEAAKAQKKFINLSPELRSERFQLNTERRDITKKLLQDPAYVRELILANESKGAEYQAAKAAGDNARARAIAEESLPGEGDVKTELDRVAPELHDQVRKQLEGEGLVKDVQGKPLGRTLGDFNRWLDQHQSDSPKAPLSERFNLARRLADKWSAARDRADIFRNRVSAAWRASLDYLQKPPVDSNTMELRKAHQFERQWTGIEIAHWVEKIQKDVPDLARRQALHIWASWEERGLSQGERETQADSVPEKFRKVFQTALNLRPAEKETGRQIMADYDQKLSDGLLSGLFQRGGRESYEGPLQWIKEPKADQQYDPEKKQFEKIQTPRNPAAKLDPRAPSFTLPREHELYEGIMAGGVPEMDVAKLLTRYNADFHGALSDRGFILGLKDAKAKDGKPVVSIGGMTEVVPRGEPGQKSFFVDSNRRGKDAITADQRPYVPMNHWALKGWKFSSVDADGNPILVKGDFWVHPDEAGWLNNVLGKSALRDPGPGVGNWRAITRGLLWINAELKAAKFAGTTMHAATITKAGISHEIASMFQGRVFNPFKKVDFDLARNAELRDAVYHGLELGFGSAQQYYMEGLASHGGVYRHVPGLAEFFQKTGDWTFKKVIPTVQTNLYRDGLAANMKTYKPKGWSDAQIKSATASQVNADVGMQNWRLLGSNPTMMDVGRSFFVAPQFLLSEAKVVGQAFKAGGARQRKMLLTTAAGSYVLARVVNQWLNGDPHWEAKNALNIIYRGRAYGTKTIVNDLWSLIQDVANIDSRPGNNTFPFAAGRLGPAVKMPYEALSGTDLRTGRRIDTYFSKGVPRAAEIALRDTAQWLTPAFVEGALPGHKGQDTTFGSALGMGSLGITSHRDSPTDETYELAAQFNRNGDAKAQRYQQQSDFDPRSAPVYHKLDDLLAGRDIGDAKKEYDALIAQGQTPKSVAQHYQVLNRKGKALHAFTGNAARESEFYDSLTPRQRSVYEQALQERQNRADDFADMLAQ